ncbi:hypothetical protein Tco_0687362 [Tanacetum coccineum]
MKKRITPDALIEGEWGFEHTKAVFLKEIIPFLKTLKDIFNVFDKDLLNEITEVQRVFNQMKAAVQQYHIDKQCFEIQKKQFLIENDRLLDQIISQDIVNIVVNSSLDINTSLNVNSSVAMNDSVNYVEMCNKSELQAKDTTNEKLKANIKRLNKTSTTNSVKKDIDEIETINIELEHKNQKSVEITDLNAQLQEEVFVITSLKKDLRKFKGKGTVDNATQVSNATTIAPRMYKLDLVTLDPKDKNSRKTHIYYLKHTMKQAAILSEIVEQAKSLNPLDSASYFACKYVKLIQELLGYVRDTCPDIHKPSEKLVFVKPINKKKTVSSMFDARHELCFLEFVSNMNARRTFTVVTKVYTRRPKVPKTNGSNSKPKIAKIIGYGDYQIGNVTISRVYYVEGLGHNLFSVGQFYDSDLEVAFRKHTCFVRNLEGVDLLSGCRGTNLYSLSIEDMMASDHRSLLAQQFVYKFTSRHGKTPYELLHDRKPDLSYLHVFGALCYPNNDSEDLGKLQAKADIGIFIGYAPKRKHYCPRLQCMTLATSSSGLVPNPIPQQLCIPPPRDDWDSLFQPMFDEYFIPPTIAASLVPVAGAPRAVALADSPVFSRVYYVEGLGHNLFSVGQFCDADLEVAFLKNTCFIKEKHLFYS